MISEDSSLVEKMRKERGSYGAVFVKLVNNQKYYNSHAFCFYEGEDGKYYDCHIRQYFHDKFITFSVGNKKEVLKLLKKVNTTDLYKNVCLMFFVDRDYDEIRESNKDLFVTPCYSIENLYVQEECLKKILQSEFGLNILEEDYQKCLQDFRLRENEFNDHLLEFNSLVYLRRKKSESNSNFSFGTVKTTHLIKFRIDEISKSPKYDETTNNIKTELGFLDNDEISKVKEELKTKGEFSWNFRGKNQLDFFVYFVKELKRLNNIGGYFTTKYNNIHIDITANRLSELSQYAIVPPILEEFLEIHKRQFSEIISS